MLSAGGCGPLGPTRDGVGDKDRDGHASSHPHPLTPAPKPAILAPNALLGDAVLAPRFPLPLLP